MQTKQWEAPALDLTEALGTVSADMVRILLGGAPIEQKNVAEILEQAGVDASMLSTPHKRIPAAQLARIWSEIEDRVDDPDLGLHLGELLAGMPKGHVLFSAMANSADLRRALERYCRFHDIMGDFAQPQLSPKGAYTHVDLHVKEGFPLHRQHVEFIFCFLVSSLSVLASVRFQGKVSFVHKKPEETADQERVFGPDIAYAQKNNKIAFSNKYLDQNIEAADHALAGVLDEYAETLLRRLRPAQPWIGKVSAQLSKSLCDGKPSLQEVAKHLAVSPRTLQNRLKEEGTSYQAVLDDLRQQMAKTYLAEADMSLAEIAFLLGYADQSAFHHAFRKWTGDSPQRFRHSR